MSDTIADGETRAAPRLLLSGQARDALRAVARRSVDKEHGGILLGCREGCDIAVEDIAEVPDTTAAKITYLRRERPAREALTAFLERTGHDNVIGYVGEWHTHPAPEPPSPTDHYAMRIIARRNRDPVALVVAALRSDHRTVDLHALISTPVRLRSRITGRYAAAVVVE